MKKLAWLFFSENMLRKQSTGSIICRPLKRTCVKARFNMRSTVLVFVGFSTSGLTISCRLFLIYSFRSSRRVLISAPKVVNTSANESLLTMLYKKCSSVIYSCSWTLAILIAFSKILSRSLFGSNMLFVFPFLCFFNC